jgi:chemotaxis protein MotA
MVADGSEERLVRQVLEIEVNFMKERHRQGQAVFKGMGTMAPAFGMIGTLIGLVRMLQNLDDPSSIGPAMAVALLTTFYGAVLANVAFLPLSRKLEVRSDEDALYMEIMTEGVISIQRGEHPSIVKEKLQAFLSPGVREETR